MCLGALEKLASWRLCAWLLVVANPKTGSLSVGIEESFLGMVL